MATTMLRLRGSFRGCSLRHFASTTSDRSPGVSFPHVHGEQSYWHNPGEEPLLYGTLGQLGEILASQFGNREALVSVHEDTRFTYKHLLYESDRVAAGLREVGLRPGERVAIWAPNCWQWITCRIGAARAGLMAVDVNPMYVEQEVKHCLELSKAAAVIAPEAHRSIRYHKLLSSVVPELKTSTPGSIRSESLPDLRAFITLSDKAMPGTLRYQDVVSAATPEKLEGIKKLQSEISPENEIGIQFSSGTTGKPKAIMVSHASVLNNSFRIGKRAGLHKKPQRVCLQVPLFHVFGTVVAMTSTFLHGGTVVLPAEGYSPADTLRAAATERCGVLTGTPTMYVDMIRIVEEDKMQVPEVDVAISGGAPLSPELVKRIMSTLRAKAMSNVFGLSECTASAFQAADTDTVDQLVKSVGKVSEHVEVKVVDENGSMVPYGTPGELMVRGYLVMKGYFGNSKATEESICDGWLRTGDKFVLYKDGYGQIVGRIKDMILRGGENIFPREIEDLLLTHPDIVETQVVSIADDRLGEEVCACIRVKPNTKLSIADLRKFCQGKISNFKIPRYSAVLEEFPRTLSGKIQKFKLRDICENLLKNGRLEDSFQIQNSQKTYIKQ